MAIIRTFGAFVVAVAVALLAASAFFTWRVIAAQQAVGAEYTMGQQAETFLMNFTGLAPQYGAILGVALAVGFLVAFVLKRILRPLAPIAYPLAGAAAVVAAILLINHFMAPGVGGAISGARDSFGLALQGLAGAIGGLAFAAMHPRKA